RGRRGDGGRGDAATRLRWLPRFTLTMASGDEEHGDEDDTKLHSEFILRFLRVFKRTLQELRYRRRLRKLQRAYYEAEEPNDFIEHIDLAAGKRFISEAYRVLTRGGVMRILTPDLRRIVQRVYIERDARHIRWCKTYLDASSPCESLNMHLRMNGDHRFLYDE